jgi:prepilin-type N-terminal cleavage/methylation domain-containing protein
MKKLPLKNKNGFTLMEVIVVMILIGIVAVALSGVIIYGVKSYIFSRDAGQLSQRAQLAMARINKELIEATAVTTATSNQIDYTSSSITYSLQRDNTNNQITLNQNGTGARVLIAGLTANNNGNPFLSYFRSDGITPWTTADRFSYINADGSSNTNYLATIKVWITLNIPNTSNHLDFQTSINPRNNGLPDAPSLF